MKVRKIRCMNLVRRRRSVRRYTGEKAPDDTVKKTILSRKNE